MAVTTTFSPINGSPTVDSRTGRAALLARMAADLVHYQAHGDERAAIRALSGRGYAMGDIVALLDDARALATEEAVRAVMAQS
jgi:hypothetical protein